MRVRKLEGIVALCILLSFATFLRIAFGGEVGVKIPEFPIDSEAVTAAGLLVAYLVLRRKLKSK